MLHGGGDVFVQELDGADSDGDEEEGFEQLEQADQDQDRG